MDRVPPRLPTTASRLIAMAASLLGDAEKVRSEVGCSPEEFRAYREAEREPPWHQVDRLVLLILREQAKAIARNRELTGKIRDRLDRYKPPVW